jgi:bisanhydrobacterioruberin hydratase
MQLLLTRIGKQEQWPLTFIVVMHLAGAIGLSSPLYNYFQLLTPANLIISATLLILTSKVKNLRFYFFMATVFALGFVAEWIGIHYEWLFGTYSYGQTLGWKIAEVPLIIGINWFIIIYSIGNIMNLFEISMPMKIIFGGGLAVLLDIFIEPVAINFDFWSWENISPPLQNYIGWFIVSVIMLLLYFRITEKESNRTAIAFYFVQLTFFVVLNLKMYLLP